MTTDYEEALAALTEDIKVGDVISNPATDPLPMVVHEVLNPNRVRLYDNETGEEYLAPKSIVGIRPSTTTEGFKKGYGLLGQVTATGDFKWVDRKPDIPTRIRSAFKCRFHPDDIEFAKWQEQGYPVCMKANLPSPASVEDHMRSKHGNQWKAIERIRELEERDAIREENRLMREALTAALGRTPPPATSAPPQAEPVAPVESTTVASVEEVVAKPRKFPSQMTITELRDYMLSKGIVFNPNVTKAANLKHLRNIEGLTR